MTVQVLPYLSTFFQFLLALLLPIIISGILYYLLRPIRDFLESKKIPRIASILIIYVSLMAILAIVVTFIWPYISQQISEFMAFPKAKIEEVQNKTIDIMNLFNFTAFSHEELRNILNYYLEQLTNFITTNIVANLGSITTIASYFIITPFILFYFLKDDFRFAANFLKAIPNRYEDSTKMILNDADEALSSYITSQVFVAFIVGLLILIGYWIIGLKYAFLLAIVAMFFNLIPFLGPFISTIPATFIGLSESPFMAIKVVLVVMVVHLLDLNLISPRIVGNRLQIHPITIILLLVSSLSIAGFFGMFLVVPLYAVIKTIVLDLLKIRMDAQVEKSQTSKG